MNTFQISVIAGFVLLAIFSVLAFAGIIPLPGISKPPVIEVTMWGSLPDAEVSPLIDDFNRTYREQYNLIYVEKDSRTLEVELVDALASGRGPDLVYAPQELIFKQANKFLPIAYDQLDQRRFKDTFIQEAQLFLYPEGVIALPLVVDPLVLYYNRDLLSTARLVGPPRTWSELEEQNKVLTIKDDRSNITQSAIALGGFNNILNAKDILSLLILQAGNPLIVREGQAWRSTLVENTLGGNVPPTASAVGFFNNFSNSANLLYSWNSSLPEARQMFARNTLAMYLGYASEYDLIRRLNPQINFDVTAVPQPNQSRLADITLGRLHSLAALRASPQGTSAIQVAVLLAWGEYASRWSELARLPPTRIDLLRSRPQDPVAAAFYDSALIARGWYDLNPPATKDILLGMAESVRQGRLELTTALAEANRELETILPQ